VYSIYDGGRFLCHLLIFVSSEKTIQISQTQTEREMGMAMQVIFKWMPLISHICFSWLVLYCSALSLCDSFPQPQGEPRPFVHLHHPLPPLRLSLPHPPCPSSLDLLPHSSSSSFILHIRLHPSLALSHPRRPPSSSLYLPSRKERDEAGCWPWWYTPTSLGVAQCGVPVQIEERPDQAALFQPNQCQSKAENRFRRSCWRDSASVQSS
jgi:hypothetical protein